MIFSAALPRSHKKLLPSSKTPSPSSTQKKAIRPVNTRWNAIKAPALTP